VKTVTQWPEWQPIETAPKDGGAIIGYCAPWECGYEVHWNSGWYLANNDPTDDWGPGPLDLTHWLPLPPPPKV
jgi:hypothetical protein